MSTAGRIVLIGNPASGRGTGAGVLQDTAERLRARGLKPELLATSRPGQAVELARAVAGTRPLLVIAVGGDGTLRDVAEGLLGAEVPLALVPAGTGNDLARTLGIPSDPAAALQVALQGEEQGLDAWTWNGTLYVNIAGIGLDAAVAEAVNHRFRRLRGAAAYVAGFLNVFPHYPPFELTLTWEGGGWSGRVWLAAFANGRCYGGGMQIAPGADPADGLLDVVVIEAIPRLALLQQFPKLFTGEHIRHPAVHIFRAPGVRVECARHTATIDGELLGESPAVVVRSPHRVSIRVPRDPETKHAVRKV